MKGQTLHLDFLTSRRKIARAFLRSSAENLYMGTSFSNFLEHYVSSIVRIQELYPLYIDKMTIKEF